MLLGVNGTNTANRGWTKARDLRTRRRRQRLRILGILRLLDVRSDFDRQEGSRPDSRAEIPNNMQMQCSSKRLKDDGGWIVYGPANLRRWLAA